MIEQCSYCIYLKWDKKNKEHYCEIDCDEFDEILEAEKKGDKQKKCSKFKSKAFESPKPTEKKISNDPNYIGKNKKELNRIKNI